jgi:hypothetical protein
MFPQHRERRWIKAVAAIERRLMLFDCPSMLDRGLYGLTTKVRLLLTATEAKADALFRLPE